MLRLEASATRDKKILTEIALVGKCHSERPLHVIGMFEICHSCNFSDTDIYKGTWSFGVHIFSNLPNLRPACDKNVQTSEIHRKVEFQEHFDVSSPIQCNMNTWKIFSFNRNESSGKWFGDCSN